MEMDVIENCVVNLGAASSKLQSGTYPQYFIPALMFNRGAVFSQPVQSDTHIHSRPMFGMVK